MKTKKTKALFLDRDGIINIDYGYVSTIEHFEFSQDIFRLLTYFQSRGYLLFIVTNQSGIGRGYYSEDAFHTLTRWMCDVLHRKGIDITEVYYCPHTPNTQCSCRKPATGMVTECMKQYNINLSASWMIGDKQSDIDFAHNLGIMHTIAIGERKIENSCYIFPTISACTHFLEENPDIINV